MARRIRIGRMQDAAGISLDHNIGITGARIDAGMMPFVMAEMGFGKSPVSRRPDIS